METLQHRCGWDEQLEQFPQVCCERVGWLRMCSADGRSLESRSSFKLWPRQQLGPLDSNFLTKHAGIFFSLEKYICMQPCTNLCILQQSQNLKIKKSLTSSNSWGAQTHSQISTFSFSSQTVIEVSVRASYSAVKGKVKGK